MSPSTHLFSSFSRISQKTGIRTKNCHQYRLILDMETHKALVLEAFATPLVLKDVPTPTVTPGSALVAPLYAWLPQTLPMVLSGALKDFVSSLSLCFYFSSLQCFRFTPPLCTSCYLHHLIYRPRNPDHNLTARVSLNIDTISPHSNTIEAYHPHIIPAKKTQLPTFPPYIPGYSCVARILTLPADATTLCVGDLVWVDPMIRGRDNPSAETVRSFNGGRDPSSQILIKGVWNSGAYAEKLLVPLEGLFKIPEEWMHDKSEGGKGFKIQEFALSGYYLLAIGGLATAGVGAGDTVIIAPATGKYSSAAVLIALAIGCRVIATGRSAEKLNVLKRYHGAKDKLSTVILTGDMDLDAKALEDATGGKGAELFVDYSPTTMREEPPYLTAGLKSLRRGGEYLLLGGALTDLKIPYGEIMLRELRIRGKFMWGREHVELFLRLIGTGSLKVGAEAGILDRLKSFRMDEVEESLKEESEWAYDEERLLKPNME